MVNYVTDKLGLVKDNEYMVVEIPAMGKALPFRVISRHNVGFEVINYGALPMETTDSLTAYSGGAVSPSAAGCMPALSYTTTAKTFEPPNQVYFGASPVTDVSSPYDANDMFYLPEDYRERLFHVFLDFTPGWLRCEVEIPKGVKQSRFQRDRSIMGVDKSFGYRRGKMEMIHFPEMHVGYQFGNDTNVEVYTSMRITYGEYIIGIPTDPAIVYGLLTKSIPSHWVNLPVASADQTIKGNLEKDYGISGYVLPAPEKRDQILNDYKATAAKVKPGVAL